VGCHFAVLRGAAELVRRTASAGGFPGRNFFVGTLALVDFLTNSHRSSADRSPTPFRSRFSLLQLEGSSAAVSVILGVVCLSFAWRILFCVMFWLDMIASSDQLPLPVAAWYGPIWGWLGTAGLRTGPSIRRACDYKSGIYHNQEASQVPPRGQGSSTSDCEVGGLGGVTPL